ncbi:MAG: hybrid sensor histidine kinase/response regulator [Desulfarculus sp.]|nr:MAG: hybrid sensor histidine kinase/response regulator [Desulfarculus sp.]
MNTAATQRFNRLLVIDDEPGIRRMMSLSLAADGYQVHTAGSGAEGLKVFARERPDIVLTDIKMPGMDGMEVLRRIKEHDPATEVIVITGHGDLDLAIRSLQLEASDFVTKPINDQALAVALARAAERLALKAELRAYTQDLEKKVAEATAKVLASERLAAVGQTVSALVHSIKNMLAGLKGGTYLVSEGLAKDRRDLVAGGLEMLQRNVGRVQELVGDLLTISKPRTPERAACALCELAAEAVACMQPQARDRGVELVLGAVPPEINAELDQKMILDALLNLISNGLDAAATVSKGRVELSVSSRGGEVCLQVADNGPGLEPEALAHIFEGFYSSKGAAGTGLGLMVCAKSAQEHGGRVEYDNHPGQGAVFRLVLPARPAGAAAAT